MARICQIEQNYQNDSQSSQALARALIPGERLSGYTPVSARPQMARICQIEQNYQNDSQPSQALARALIPGERLSGYTPVRQTSLWG